MNDPKLTVWHEALTSQEHELLAAWVRYPRMRQLWEPTMAEMFSFRAKAIAKACVTLRARGFADDVAGDIGVQLVAQLSNAGDLGKHWAPGQAPLPYEGSRHFEKDLARWRSLRCLFALRHSLQDCLETTGPGSDLSKVRESILEAAEAARPEERSRDYSRPEEASVGFAAAARKNQTGYYSGFDALDRATGGLRPGHVWVLGAPTNWGKSNFLIAVREHHLMVHGHGAVLVTCEDDPELVALRTLAKNAQVNSLNARNGQLTGDETARATEYLHDSSRPNASALVLMDGRGKPVEQLAFELRSHIARFNLRLVLVDYLQCIGSERQSQDRRAEINFIARTLTDAVKTSGAAGLFASQVTGEDVRESRDVEHAAEVVLIGKGGKNEPHEVLVKKNKTGPANFTIRLDWNENTGSFTTRGER